MGKLNEITIQGFKSIKDQKIEVKDLNILIGANGAGKSNFIGSFEFLGEITKGNLSSYIKTKGGANSMLHFGSKYTSELYFHLKFWDSVDQYSIKLAPTENDELVPVDERTYYWNKSSYPSPYVEILPSNGVESYISKDSLSRVASYVKNELDSWRIYHFHDVSSSSPLKKTSKIDDNDYLRGDGSNIASFLYLLKENHRVEYNLIVSSVRSMAPFFKDFHLKPRALKKDQIRLRWKHVQSEDYFDCSDFSDGTLRFVALATLLLQPKELMPSIILIDEPELGLHPYAITVLGGMINSASKKVQIIVSTQSPMFLDMFEPEDVITANASSEGTIFERLKAENLGDWLDEYSLGQLWEKNEIGARPGGR